MTATEGPPARPGSVREQDPTTRLIAAISAAVAASLTLIATWRGAGLGPDSVSYFSAGMSLADGHGLTTFSGTTLTMFPPGLPALVAVGQWIGLDASMTLRLVNAAAYAATVWLTYLLLVRHVRSRTIVRGAVVLTAVSVTLLGVAEMALSECTFIVVCLGLLLVIEHLATTSRPAPLLVAGSALVWAGFMLRYAGIALLPIGVTAIFLGRWPDVRRAVLWAGSFGALGLVVPVAWMLRNHSVDGTIMGPRSSSPDGPVITVQRFVATLGRWVVPDPAPVGLQAVAGVALLVAVGALLAWVLIDPTRRAEAVPRGTIAPLVPLLAFVFIYSGYLIAAQLATAFDPIGTRLMSPLYPPLVVLLAVVLDRVGVLVPATTRRTITMAIGGLFLCFLLVNAAATARHTLISARDGVGYAERTWQDSELAATAATEVPVDADLYSNVPAALWTVLEREPLVRSPEKSPRRGGGQIAMSEKFLADVACHESYLAWSDRGVGNYLFTPEELEAYVGLTVVSVSDDGTLYRLESSEPGAGGDKC